MVPSEGPSKHSSLFWPGAVSTEPALAGIAAASRAASAMTAAASNRNVFTCDAALIGKQLPLLTLCRCTDAPSIVHLLVTVFIVHTFPISFSVVNYRSHFVPTET